MKRMLFEIPSEPVSAEKLKEFNRIQKDREKVESIQRFKDSGVPVRFYNESFETFTAELEGEKKAKLKTQNFAKNPQDKILILYGENGNGKTHLGSAVLKDVIENGGSGCFILSSLLCVKYDSATSYRASMSREDILNYYSKIKMLVIDECCKYFVNQDLEKFVLSYIISARYANKLPTVLITNGKKEAFVNFLGKAVYDRFTQVCETVEFNWESKRKALRK